MKAKWIFVMLLVAALLLPLSGWTQAQGVPPSGDAPAAPEAVGAIAPGAIPIQGKLTDASGRALPDGNYQVTFRLYETETGGTALCADSNTVAVQDGLFSSYVDYCYNHLHGQKVWLAVEVEGDGEMTPRQPIYAVPYALSLVPGAVISYTTDRVLTVRSTGTGDSDAFIAQAGSTGEAVEAIAENGVGVFAVSQGYLALQAYSYNGDSHPALFGCVAADHTVCDPYRDDTPAGIAGYGAFGVYGFGTSIGVEGESGASYGFAGYFHHTDGGIALVADSTAADNDDIVRFRNHYDIKFKVQGDGDVYIDGTFYNTGADFAEMLPAQGELQPGDVLVIGAEGTLVASEAAFQTTVAGVYSTRPAYIGGAGSEAAMIGQVPLAVVGIVPCKVSAENGPIRPGDLLVTASLPGHAMRAGENPPQGTVLGKALEGLEADTGTILILVTLQ